MPGWGQRHRLQRPRRGRFQREHGPGPGQPRIGQPLGHLHGPLCAGRGRGTHRHHHPHQHRQQRGQLHRAAECPGRERGRPQGEPPGQTISGTYNTVLIANGGAATVAGTLTVNTALTVQSELRAGHGGGEPLPGRGGGRAIRGAGADANAGSRFPGPRRRGHPHGCAARRGVTVYDALGRPVTTATADAAGTAALVLPGRLTTGVYVVRVGRNALRLTVK